MELVGKGLIEHLTRFAQRWRRGFLEVLKDNSSECIPAGKYLLQFV